MLRENITTVQLEKGVEKMAGGGNLVTWGDLRNFKGREIVVNGTSGTLEVRQWGTKTTQFLHPGFLEEGLKGGNILIGDSRLGDEILTDGYSVSLLAPSLA